MESSYQLLGELQVWLLPKERNIVEEVGLAVGSGWLLSRPPDPTTSPLIGAISPSTAKGDFLSISNLSVSNIL